MKPKNFFTLLDAQCRLYFRGNLYDWNYGDKPDDVIGDVQEEILTVPIGEVIGVDMWASKKYKLKNGRLMYWKYQPNALYAIEHLYKIELVGLDS